MLVDRQLRHILQSTGCQSPALGGSTVSILAALLGVSMIRMAIVISRDKVEPDENLADALAHTDAIAGKLEKVADDDQSAFRRYLEALKLPKEPSGNAAARDDALDSVEGMITSYPLMACEVILEAMELAGRAADRTHETVLSDLYGGAALLNGAFVGVVLAVQINLKSDRMTNIRSSTMPEIAKLQSRRAKVFALLSASAAAQGFQM